MPAGQDDRWERYGRKKIMLDIKFVRENPDVVKQNIKNKFQEHKLPLVDEVIALDKERRETQQKADDLRAPEIYF